MIRIIERSPRMQDFVTGREAVYICNTMEEAEEHINGLLDHFPWWTCTIGNHTYSDTHRP